MAGYLNMVTNSTNINKLAFVTFSRVFSSDTNMMVGAARPFSRIGTALWLYETAKTAKW